VARRNTASEQVTQHVHMVAKKRKRALLSFLIGRDNWQQVLVFTRTKHGANHLAEQLNKDGITAAAIHGNKSQGARTRALSDFKEGKIRVLVATDIAARGIDIEELPHVVNFELPNVPEDYVHRIGRTGRAAAVGEALSLVCVDELKLLRDIERVLKREIPRMAIEGYEPDPSIKAEPIINGRQQQRGGAGGGGGRGRGAQGGQRSGGDRSASGNRAGNGGGNGAGAGGERRQGNGSGRAARPEGGNAGAPRVNKTRPRRSTPSNNG